MNVPSSQQRVGMVGRTHKTRPAATAYIGSACAQAGNLPRGNLKGTSQMLTPCMAVTRRKAGLMVARFGLGSWKSNLIKLAGRRTGALPARPATDGRLDACSPLHLGHEGDCGRSQFDQPCDLQTSPPLLAMDKWFTKMGAQDCGL